MAEKQGVPEPIPEERTDVLPAFDPERVAAVRRNRYTLTLLTGPTAGLVHLINAEQTVLGRGQECQVRIEDTALSRRHCWIVKQPDGYYLQDLGSTNGTFVDGERLSAARRLQDGTRIHMGRETILKFARQDLLEAEAALRLYESAMNDPLTGVRNRRYFDEHLRSEFAYAERHGSALSFMILDADHFKQVNDTWGHAAGDAVLKALAEQLQRTIRAEDILARYGGEEFAVLARGITADGAVAFSERIRKSIELTPIPHEAELIRVTVSIGFVTMDLVRGFPGADALLAAADAALYRAKEAGRNRSERG